MLFKMSAWTWNLWTWDLYCHCQTYIIIALLLCQPGVRKSQWVGRKKREGKTKTNQSLGSYCHGWVTIVKPTSRRGQGWVVKCALPLWKLYCCCGSCIAIMEAASLLWKLHHLSRRGQGQVIKHASPSWKLYRHHGSCIAVIEAVLPSWKLHRHCRSCITIVEAASPIKERAGAGY